MKRLNLCIAGEYHAYLVKDGLTAERTNNMQIGIVGFGHVGTAMKAVFRDAVVYDEPKHIGSQKDINVCDVVFVCVPTPQDVDGSCNTKIVESVIQWISSEVIVLRSTVPVGFTESMCKKYGKRICFQPEYYGETVAHPFADIRNQHWITIGGEDHDASVVARAYKSVFTSSIVVNIVDSKTAELAKYMENCYLATKVVFCNEFYDIATKLGVNYDRLRETWLLDPRIGRSHTFVYENNRGFSGSCLPKDTMALVSQCRDIGADASFIEAVIQKNNRLRKSQEP